MAVIVELPRLTDTMEEGVIAQWHIAEGDKVKRGQVIADIETDKATMEFESFDAGIVLKLIAAEGDTLGLGAPIAVLGKKDEDVADLIAGLAAQAQAEPEPEPEAETEVEAEPVAATPSSPEPEAPVANTLENGRIPASPLARRLAREAGLELSQIEGSGPHGRIIKADIEAAKASGVGKAAPVTAAAQPAAAPASASEPGMPSTKVLSGGAEYLTKLGVEAGSYDLIPLNGIQKVVAKRLAASNNNVPDFPLTIDCELDELLKMRKDLNAQAPEGIKISVNDMLIRASALALKHVPAANASFTPDGIAMHKHADVAVAVAICAMEETGRRQRKKSK